jgi:hypothetical protein
LRGKARYDIAAAAGSGRHQPSCLADQPPRKRSASTTTLHAATFSDRKLLESTLCNWVTRFARRIDN